MNTIGQTLRPGLGDERPATYYPTRDGAVLLGRVLLAVLFIWSGAGKLMGFGGAAGAIASKGLPLPQVLAALTILIELGGGLALAFGWKARWAAVLLALFVVIITPIFHNFWASPPAQVMSQQINFFKNVSILGGMLVVYAFGPGRYSLDRG
jgi:putative oxidoreductase